MPTYGQRRSRWADELNVIDAHALGGLVGRSNLLGRDRSLCNYGGGNTSALLELQDPVSRQMVRVMAVKASGCDLRTMGERDFALLYFDELAPLFDNETMDDDAMTEAVMLRVVREAAKKGVAPRKKASIEALLHAGTLLARPDARHVDHSHADAAVTIACSPNPEHHMREVWGDKAVFVPFIRPGFDLSKQIKDLLEANPQAELVLMGKHGLVTWGASSEECYNKTLEVVEQAEAYIAARKPMDFMGDMVVPALNFDIRDAVYRKIAPELRGALSGYGHTILHLDHSEPILRWVGSDRLAEVASKGAPCPDHLPNVGPWPLILQMLSARDVGQQTVEYFAEAALKEFREEFPKFIERFTAYFETGKQEGDVMGSPIPRVILIPGLGMITTGPNIERAKIAAELYHRALPVLSGAEALGGFCPLTELEARNIQFWPLELYKATLQATPKEFAGRVVVVTGGANGIGRAAAMKFAALDAHVAILDYNSKAAGRTEEEIRKAGGRVRSLCINITDLAQINTAIGHIISAWGGIDILVNNAGIADKTVGAVTAEHFDRLFDVNGKGAFMMSSTVEQVLIRQGLGGAVIHTSSKNGVKASAGAAVYNATKAALEHYARTRALEQGPKGIRHIIIRPDAVLDSAIWDADGDWLKGQLKEKGFKTKDELLAHYAGRCPLGVNVFCDDIAEGIVFAASPKRARVMTGAAIDLTGGSHL